LKKQKILLFRSLEHLADDGNGEMLTPLRLFNWDSLI
jgi:hypothetical protein